MREVLYGGKWKIGIRKIVNSQIFREPRLTISVPFAYKNYSQMCVKILGSGLHISASTVL